MDSHTAREKNQVPGTEKALLKRKQQINGSVGGCNALQVQCNSNRNYWKRNHRMQGAWKVGETKTSVDVLGIRGCNRLNLSSTTVRNKGIMGIM